MDNISKSGIPKLDLDNYHTWSVQVKCWLVTKDLHKHTQATVAAERGNDAKALAHIGMTLTEQHLPTFSECDTAKAAWDAFAKLFRNKSQARRLLLQSELSAFHKDSGEPLVKYFARAKYLKSQLLSVGSTLDENELCLSVLNGLPMEYETLCTVLATTDTELTLDDLLPKLLVVENKAGRSASEGKALFLGKPGAGSQQRRQGSGTPKRTGKETRKCHHCDKPGHLKKDCWQRQREEQGTSGRTQGQNPQGQGYRGTQGNVACAAMPAGEGSAWLLDSGASSHIAMSQHHLGDDQPEATAFRHLYHLRKRQQGKRGGRGRHCHEDTWVGSGHNHTHGRVPSS